MLSSQYVNSEEDIIEIPRRESPEPSVRRLDGEYPIVRGESVLWDQLLDSYVGKWWRASFRQKLDRWRVDASENIIHARLRLARYYASIKQAAPVDYNMPDNFLINSLEQEIDRYDRLKWGLDKIWQYLWSEIDLKRQVVAHAHCKNFVLSPDEIQQELLPLEWKNRYTEIYNERYRNAEMIPYRRNEEGGSDNHYVVTDVANPVSQTLLSSFEFWDLARQAGSALIEIERRVPILKRDIEEYAAVQQTRYEYLDDRLRRLEASYADERKNELIQQAAKKVGLAKIRSDLAETEANFAKMETELTATKTKQAAMEARLAATKTEQAAMEARLAATKTEQAATKSKLIEVKERCERLIENRRMETSGAKNNISSLVHLSDQSGRSSQIGIFGGEAAVVDVEHQALNLLPGADRESRHLY